MGNIDLSELDFEYDADREFFENLLEDLVQMEDINVARLFDFRAPVLKRKEFNRIRNKLFRNLVDIYGEVCMLGTDLCDLSSGFAVDHIIPLSSNKLNKRLRNLKAEPGKKVKTQSFGSNNMENLIIACSRCNNHKKHRLLSREKIYHIFKEKTQNRS